MAHEAIPKTEAKNQKTTEYLEEVFNGSDVYRSDVRSIEISEVAPIITAENAKTGIETGLVSIIRAGDELFAVIAVRKDGDSSDVAFAISRFRDGERGQLIDVISQHHTEANNLGRESIRDLQNPIDDTMSRNHFSIKLTESGKITVTDNGSANGTQLFARFKDEPGAEEPLPEGPLDDFTWLPESASLRHFCFPKDRQ